MRSGFSVAAFAMVKSSSDIPSECVMPTSVSNQDSITNTILQCYTDSGISLTGSSFASFAKTTASSASSASSSSSDSDLSIIGSDFGFASTSSDTSSLDWGFSSDGSAWADTDVGFSSGGIASDSTEMLERFCASSSCKQMIVIFKQLWPTDCSIDGTSLYELVDEVNTVCSWSSTTTSTSSTTSLTGSSALALTAMSAAALLLLV